MNVYKNFPVKTVILWSWPTILGVLIYSLLIMFLYQHDYVTVELPLMPISLLGTAVAFYVGFKNNSSYDRLWEARKVWGAVVNSSRAWGMYVCGFVTNQFRAEGLGEKELHDIKQRLIYRHIAWLYTLRSQLLVPTEWEHISQKGRIGREAKRFRKQYGIGMVTEETNQIKSQNFLSPEEYKELQSAKNKATQLVNNQSQDLTELRHEYIIEDFRHMEMMEMLYDFYNEQGKLERIKKFPLPRQYANMSNYFVMIFVFLLPFSLIPTLYNIGSPHAGFIAVFLNMLISWVYIMMESVGDYSENPFEGMANDIPMLSISRAIEIDLRQMLGETELPPPIESKNGILM